MGINRALACERSDEFARRPNNQTNFRATTDRGTIREHEVFVVSKLLRRSNYAFA